MSEDALVGSSFFAQAPGACRRLAQLSPKEPRAAVADAERALASVTWHETSEVARWTVSQPEHAIIALAALADRPRSLVGERLAEVFPELAGLAISGEVRTSEPLLKARVDDRQTPLVDSALRALAAVRDRASALDEATAALVTTVVLFAEVARGGTIDQRGEWRQRLGVDGSVNNEDSAEILADVQRRVLDKAALSEDGRFSARALALCSAVGLVMHRLSGDVGREVFAPLRQALRREQDGGASMMRAFGLINYALAASERPVPGPLAQALRAEEEAVLGEGGSDDDVLVERFTRLRAGVLPSPEDTAAAREGLNALDESQRETLSRRLMHCRIWGNDGLFSRLAPETGARLLAYAAGTAAEHQVDFNHPWHLSFGPLTQRLDPDPSSSAVERSIVAVLAVPPTASLMHGRLEVEGEPLFVVQRDDRGGDDGISVGLSDGGELRALLSLLPRYEAREAAETEATRQALERLLGLEAGALGAG